MVDIFKSLQEVFKRALEQDVKIDSNTSRDNTPEWDSLAHLNLIIELEEEFGIEFNREEIPLLDNVDKILKKISKKGGGLNEE